MVRTTKLTDREIQHIRQWYWSDAYIKQKPISISKCTQSALSYEFIFLRYGQSIGRLCVMISSGEHIFLSPFHLNGFIVECDIRLSETLHHLVPEFMLELFDE